MRTEYLSFENLDMDGQSDVDDAGAGADNHQQTEASYS